MGKYINKVQARDGKDYTIKDQRIPTPTVADAGKVLGVDTNGKLGYITPSGPIGKDDQLEALLNDELETLTFDKPIKTIRKYLAAGSKALKAVSINGVKDGIGECAFINTEHLTSLELGKVDGEIGDCAFTGTVNVGHFYLDPKSNITKLGLETFAGIGMDRNSSERFVFDFRNSTFTDFAGFGTPSTPASTDSSTGEIIVDEVLGYGITNADIYLPETVESFAGYKWNSSQTVTGYWTGGSGGVLNNCTDITLYITNKSSVIPLKESVILPNDKESQIFVPLEIYADYKLATNWAAYENLGTYIENSTKGIILSAYDTEGYELAWYKDKTLTEPTTLGTGSTVYGIQTGSRLRSKVIIENAYKGSVQITSGTTTFNVGDLIPIGTEITITPICTESGTPTLVLFNVNDQSYSSPVTMVTTEDNIFVDVYYNIEEIPAYFKLENERSYSPTSEINTLAYNNTYTGELPSHIDIQPYYFQNGNIYEVKYLKYGSFRNKLTDKDYYVTLPDTLVRVGDFFGCTRLISINIPKNITSLENFTYCSNLEDIGILSKKINYVSASCFGSCDRLETVYYEGRPEDIDIYVAPGSPESSSNQHFKDNVIYYYSEEAPTCSDFKWWHYVNGIPTPWPKEEHHLVGPDIIKNRIAPTYTSDGGYDIYRTCETCGKEFFVEHIIIPHLEHNYSTEWSYDENTHWHACIDDGYEDLRADEAAHELDEGIYVPPTDEEDGYYLGTCKICGASSKVPCNPIEPALNNFTFTLLANDTYEVAKKNSLSGNIILPNQYNGKDVTSIGYEAFLNCNLTSITIPDSVTLISERAFYQCSNLTSVIVPSSVISIGASAFRNCYKLSSINIPDSVTSIGESAFNGCSKLTSITIPDSVTSISSYVFADCISITSVVIPDSVTSIGQYAFADCSALASIVIPNSVTSIGDAPFKGCSSLTSITIPNGITSIRYRAFYNCSNLTLITIPNNITSIGNQAFAGCSSLTSITIPDSVSSLGRSAFLNCSNLYSVTLGTGLNTIDYNTFEGCSALASINIPNSITTINSSAFDGCSSLKSFQITDNVKSIGNYALRQTGITSLFIPAQVTNCDTMLNCCSDLVSLVVDSNNTVYDSRNNCNAVIKTNTNELSFGCNTTIIPDTVSTIGFASLSGLDRQSIDIPVSVKTINGQAFAYCNNLTAINYHGTITDWSKIKLWEGWKDHAPQLTVIHCTDGDIQL